MALRAFEGLWRRANSRPADGDNPGRAVTLRAPNFLLPMEGRAIAYGIERARPHGSRRPIFGLLTMTIEDFAAEKDALRA